MLKAANNKLHIGIVQNKSSETLPFPVLLAIKVKQLQGRKMEAILGNAFNTEKVFSVQAARCQ